MPVPAMTDTKCSSFRLMCARILLITCRSSIHAMILMAPWQCLHTVTSMLNTRFSRIAQLIFPRRSSPSAIGSVVAGNEGCFSLPSLVTAARCLLFGANTPWNIYLHYVLDLWIDKVVKPRMQGYVYYTRYLDDFVLCFEYKSDANRFRSVLSKRLEKFCLSLELTKTKLLEFGRFAERGKETKGKAETFNFLGFTFYCTKNRKGGFKVGMKTEKSRLRRSCAKMKEILLRIRHTPVREQRKMINVRLSGHYRYYGVGGNAYCIDHFYYFTLRFWRKALSSRSQNGKVNWVKFNKILKIFPLRQPKLSLPYTAMKGLVTL